METQLDEVALEHRCAGVIVGMARAYTMDTRTEIPQLWQAVWGASDKVGKAEDAVMHGLSFDQDASGGFKYGVGWDVDAAPDALPEGFCVMHISGGDYAVRRAFGPLTELPAVFDDLFNTWLPQSGRSMREGAVFESYPQDERNTMERMAYEIWIPLAPAA